MSKQLLLRSAPAHVIAVSILLQPSLLAQSPGAAPKVGGSPNVQVLSHVPIRGFMQVGDIELEQEISRPYAYLSRLRLLTDEAGFTVIGLKDPRDPEMLYSWRIEDAELHGSGLGGTDGKYFKYGGRYYYVQSFQFGQSGPNADLGAVVFDVTGLPDTSMIREVARMRVPEIPNGFHNIFMYKHSSGQPLLFAAFGGSGQYAYVYDMARVVSGEAARSLAGKIPVPGDLLTSVYIPGYTRPIRIRGYHDMYVGYDPASRQDRFYGAGSGGYYVYDVTNPENPRILTSITGADGVPFGHTFTPTPDGCYAVAETEYQHAPLRIFDLQPGLDGEVETITRPVGAWTADWRALVHQQEVRWPYVFVPGYEDGLQVFNMMDPTAPHTVGHYYTCECPHERGWAGNRQAPPGESVYNGAMGVDIRNEDGLIALSDSETGFWAFRLDGFDGWNGHDWGVPNISSAQDWENGPEGADAGARVSAR